MTRNVMQISVCNGSGVNDAGERLNAPSLWFTGNLLTI